MATEGEERDACAARGAAKATASRVERRARGRAAACMGGVPSGGGESGATGAEAAAATVGEEALEASAEEGGDSMKKEAATEGGDGPCDMVGRGGGDSGAEEWDAGGGGGVALEGAKEASGGSAAPGTGGAGVGEAADTGAADDAFDAGDDGGSSSEDAEVEEANSDDKAMVARGAAFVFAMMRCADCGEAVGGCNASDAARAWRAAVILLPDALTGGARHTHGPRRGAVRTRSRGGNARRRMARTSSSCSTSPSSAMLPAPAFSAGEAVSALAPGWVGAPTGEGWRRRGGGLKGRA